MTPSPSPSPFPSPFPSPSLPQAGRRSFCRLVGGGLVFAAAAPLAGCAAGLPATATAAWRSAPEEADDRRYVLAHALLAPNPHNRQPWIADLTAAPDRIDLLLDTTRLLPHTDPFARQVLIGCGAFLELSVVAAAQRGRAAAVTLFPDGAPPVDRLPAGPPLRVATLRLGDPGSAVPDPLHAQVLRRHTDKGAYAAGRALPPALAAQWVATAASFRLAAGVVADDAALGALRGIARRAYEIECTTPRTWLESARLMRIGPQAIDRHRDGISIIGAVPRAMHALGVFDPMVVPTPGSSELQRVMDRWAAFETGSGFVWMASRGNDRASQVAAGRAHLRMHLQATAAGVALHPLSQALQEFAEMQGERAALHRTLGLDAAATPLQMFSRAGFALQPAGPSPRRGLPDLLRT